MTGTPTIPNIPTFNELFKILSGGDNSLINPGDGLSLDLAFALDKTLTARRGPTPVFTRASTGTFVGSNGFIQSAAINAPRFDYDPVTLECKGLLIEESRTNLTINSQTPSGWIHGNGTVTDHGLTTSPSGLNDGYLAGVGTADISSANTSSLPSGAYTISVFLKRNNTNWVRLQLSHATNKNVANAWFNLATGVKGYASAGNGSITSITSAITNVGNGWYRCSITATIPTSGAVRAIIISAASDANAARVSGAIYAIWGFQIEAGAFPTSYIPTTTTALTRSADVCSISGGDFSSLWNPREGTIFVEFSMIATFSITGRAIHVCQASNNTFSELVRIGTATNSLAQVLDTTIGAWLTSLPATVFLSLTAKNKSAGSYKGGRNAISSNGSTVATVSPADITSLVNRLDIGAMHPLSGQPAMCGHICKIQYYKNYLSDERLQSLTAP